MTQAPAPPQKPSKSGPFSALGHWFDGLLHPLKPRQGAAAVTELMQGDDPQRYLDPAALARFGVSPLICKKVVEGFISGLHRSPFHGFSVEFADHREYVPGDDLKYLDWGVFARTDHYYIRRYEEETNVRCHILLDRSASMAFGTASLTKWDYACFLASCLTYLMIKQQDAVGLAMLGERPGIMVPPRTRGSHLTQVMSTMVQNPPTGGTDLAGSLRAMMRNLKRRSLVVVISDLIDDPDETIRALRMIGSHKHDVLVFHTLDPAELSFTFDGSTMFRDLETGEMLEVDPAAIRESYLEQLEEYLGRYRKRLTEVGIDYETIDTTTPYEHALWRYLQKRASVAK